MTFYDIKLWFIDSTEWLDTWIPPTGPMGDTSRSDAINLDVAKEMIYEHLQSSFDNGRDDITPRDIINDLTCYRNKVRWMSEEPGPGKLMFTVMLHTCEEFIEFLRAVESPL